MKAGSRPGLGNAYGLISVCLGLHVLADTLLITRAWFLDGYLLWVALSLPLSQASLVVIWAACTRAPALMRFAVAPAALFACWYVLMQTLSSGSIGDTISAVWALGLAVQAMTIVILIALYRVAHELYARRRADHERTSMLSYNILTLMLWTMLVALGFGLVNHGRANWGWTASKTEWELLKAIPVIGVSNGLIAVIWVWALTLGRWRWRFAKIVVAAGLVAAVGYFEPKPFQWVIGFQALDTSTTLTVAVAQSTYLVFTLGLMLLGYWWRRPDEPGAEQSLA